MKHFLPAVLLLFTLFWPAALRAQLPIRPVVFSSATYDHVVSATSDAADRMYVLGYHSQAWTGGNPPPPVIRTPAGNTPMLSTSSDYFVAIYSADGRLERQHSLGSGLTLNSIALDRAGNVYLTGSQSQYSFLLRKLNASFQFQWDLTYGTSGGAWGSKVLTDAQGDVYVTGTVQNWSIFGLSVRTRSCCPSNDFTIKVNSQGVLQWVQAGLGGTNENLTSSGSSLALDRAGNVVMVGIISGMGTYGTVSLAGGHGNVLAVKYSPAGNVLWARSYGDASYTAHGSTGASDVAIDENDNLYLAGNFQWTQQYGTITLNNPYLNADALLLKLDPDGEPLWARAGGYVPGTNLAVNNYTSVAYRAGKLKVTGYSSTTQGVYENTPLVAAYETNGHFAWRTNLHNSNIGAGTKVLIDNDQTSHVFGYFKNTFQVGTNQFASYGLEDGFYVQLLDSARYQSSCTIRGMVYHDNDQNCQAAPAEARLAGIVVEALPGPYYGITDSLGRYSINTDTGRYTVRQYLPQLPGHTITPRCPATNVSPSLVLPSPGSVAADVDFGDELPHDPYLVVNVAAGRRRRCAAGSTTVTYANLGVVAATGAQVVVKMPRYVLLLSASHPYTRQVDSSYVFVLGRLEAGQTGTIMLKDSVMCGNPAIRGLTVCTQAWITPVVFLPRPANWNQASIRIRGRVQAGNEVRFAVRNDGLGSTTDSLALRLYQGTQLALTHRFALPAGDSLVLRVPARQAVVRLEADQPPAHPFGPQTSATLEVVALRPAGGAPSPAMTAFPPAPLPPTTAEECLPIVDSFDPNDKQVLPAGLTARHYTPKNGLLHYQIRFQNTGSAEANRVVVVDTLAANLDISTLQAGAASHPYRLQVQGRGRPVLVFTFAPIHLPDSTTNEAGSHGFVQFAIRPTAGQPDSALLLNHADIYFDYNPPVRTNTTLNRLYDLPATVQPAVALSYPAVLASPSLLSMAPDRGRSGTLVTLTGQRFALNQADNQVLFNGVAATIEQATATSLRVRVPAGASPGKIQVITPDGGVRSATDFLAYQVPTLAAVVPAEARPGAVVSLSGLHFSPDAALDTVWFNGVAARVVQATATTLQVEVPTNATRGRIRLSTLGGTVESADLFQVWYPPTLSGVSPARARAGAVITLSGTNFAETASRNVVAFGGGAGAVLQATAGSMQVRVPTTAASGTIQLDTPGGTATAAGFVFLPAPVVATMTPASGSVDTEVVLTGSHFNVEQTDTVFFGALAAPVLQGTATELRVRVPKGARTGLLTVAGVGGRGLSAEAFRVQALSNEEAVAVYPNPTPGDVVVDWARAEFTVQTVQVYNTLGQLVQEFGATSATAGQLRVPLGGHRPGMYLLLIQTTAGPVLKRVSLR